MQKKCTRCKEEKELVLFGIDNSTKSGISSTCKSCLNLGNEIRRRERVKQGSCRSCKRLKLHNCQYCLYHWAHHLVSIQSTKKHLKLSHLERTTRTKHLLGKLSNQNFKCFYTGVVLIPALNASLDHIEPHSKNGNDELTNLVWTDRSFNTIKNTGSIDLAKQRFNVYLQALKTNEYPMYE